MTYQAGNTARQKVPRHFYLKTFLIYLIPVFFICAGHVVFKYREIEASSIRTISDLNRTISDLKSKISVRETEICKYRDEINTQRLEIEKIVGKLDSLEGKLADLGSLGKQLQTIAMNEPRADSPSLFGIGGPGDAELPPEAGDMRKLMAHADNLDDVSSILDDAFKDYLKRIKAKKKRLASKPTICPVKGETTSRFGSRISPFTGRREFHTGLDISANKGTPVFAAADGVVTWSGRKGLLGNLLTIDHGNDIVTRYGHLNKLLKKAGQRVKKGEKIALVGNTGRSTGSHLHYEVRLSGAPVDPEIFITD